MTIPDEAVEAAAKAVLANFHGPDDHHSTWHLNPKTVARAALTAAAPHLHAEAWDEGWRKCESYVDGPDWSQLPVNTYRAARLAEGTDT